MLFPEPYSEKERFEKQVLYLDQNGQVVFIGCNALMFCEGKSCGEREFPERPIKEDFLFRMPFLHPTLMFRKTVLDDVNGYDESRWTILCEDYDLLLRIYEKHYWCYNLQEKLFHYQITKDDYKKRKFHHRVNESITRYKRFKAQNMLPKALPSFRRKS